LSLLIIPSSFAVKDGINRIVGTTLRFTSKDLARVAERKNRDDFLRSRTCRKSTQPGAVVFENMYRLGLRWQFTERLQIGLFHATTPSIGDCTMIQKLLCVILVAAMLAAGPVAVAGTPMPIPPSQDLRALGPQPEPPDYPVWLWGWIMELFSSMLDR
jgi:hypothetical protein